MNEQATAGLAVHDSATIGAIAIVAYCLATAGHEIAGHGLVAHHFGLTYSWCTNAGCAIDLSSASDAARRWVVSAGCGVNVLIAAVSLACGAAMPGRASVRYATWLIAHINLFMAFGYLMVFPFLPLGDWHEFVVGLAHPVAWKFGLTIAGIVGYALTQRHAASTLEEFLPRSGDARKSAARQLCVLPYLTGGATNVVATLAGPGASALLVSAVPSTFGGVAGLFVLPQRIGDSSPGDRVPIRIARSWRWLCVGGIVGLFYVFVLGAGLVK